MSKVYLCGVPKEQCQGALKGLSKGLSDSNVAKFKVHNNPEEAFNCYAKYLVSQGCKGVGSREYQTPTGEIQILTKKSRFGGVLKTGKRSEGSSVKGSRYVPAERMAGVIIRK